MQYLSGLPAIGQLPGRLFRAMMLTIVLLAPPAWAALDQPACERLRMARVLGPNAPVGCDRLAVVRFSYVDFSGASRDDGEIMVLDAVAPEVGQLFQSLYQRRFPLARARLIEHYRGDDEASMRDNNTSAFNHRVIAGGGPPSLHAYGLAIDINPVQNPFLQARERGMVRVSPPAGTAYLNRLPERPGKPGRPGMAEEVVRLFAEAGFAVWGGHWDEPVDYQHFQFPRRLAEQLVALPAPQARQVFLQRIKAYRGCLSQYPAHAGMACALDKP